MMRPDANWGTCQKCGARVPPDKFPCDCGETLRSYEMMIIIEGAGYSRVSSKAVSELRVSETGELWGSLNGVEAGGYNEPWVLLTLQEQLKRLGHAVEVKKGRNAFGEDGQLTVDGTHLVVQITSVLDQTFWSQAAQGEFEISLAPDQVLQLMREAIDRKTAIPPDLRKETILVLDAQHLGPVCRHDRARDYVVRFGDPHESFGFSSVWLVGPSAEACVRLGTGFP